MRILNQDNDNAIKKILILLTTEEATELRDDLGKMLQKNQSNEHAHINDKEYIHEITFAIYKDGEIDSYNERTKTLIVKDE